MKRPVWTAGNSNENQVNKTQINYSTKSSKNKSTKNLYEDEATDQPWIWLWRILKITFYVEIKRTKCEKYLAIKIMLHGRKYFG